MCLLFWVCPSSQLVPSAPYNTPTSQFITFSSRLASSDGPEFATMVPSPPIYIWQDCVSVGPFSLPGRWTHISSAPQDLPPLCGPISLAQGSTSPTQGHQDSSTQCSPLWFAAGNHHHCDFPRPLSWSPNSPAEASLCPNLHELKAHAHVPFPVYCQQVSLGHWHVRGIQ